MLLSRKLHHSVFPPVSRTFPSLDHLYVEVKQCNDDRRWYDASHLTKPWGGNCLMMTQLWWWWGLQEGMMTLWCGDQRSWSPDVATISTADDQMTLALSLASLSLSCPFSLYLSLLLFLDHLHCVWGSISQNFTAANGDGLEWYDIIKWLDALRGSSPAHCINGTWQCDAVQKNRILYITMQYHTIQWNDHAMKYHAMKLNKI